MSEAFQCDICGSFYAKLVDPYGRKYTIRKKEESSAVYLDICASCYKRIEGALDHEITLIKTGVGTRTLERAKCGIDVGQLPDVKHY